MEGFLNIKDPNTFLGGQNVHNLIIIGLLSFIIYKQVKKQKLWLTNTLTKMLKAKKEGAKSFTYNGKTYVAMKTKTGMVVYKAQK